MDVLVPSSTLSLLQERFLFGTLLNDLASFPDEPNLAHHEDSDEGGDQNCDNCHIDLALRIKTLWLSVYNRLRRLFRSRRTRIVRILLVRKDNRGWCWRRRSRSHLQSDWRRSEFTTVVSRWIWSWSRFIRFGSSVEGIFLFNHEVFCAGSLFSSVTTVLLQRAVNC